MECSFCSRVFKHRSSIVRHFRTSYCAITYNTSKPSKKETRSYECSHCDHVFEHRRYIIRHLRVCHNDPASLSYLQKKEKLSFECLYCGQIFSYKNNLKRHIHHFHTVHDGRKYPNHLPKNTRSIVGFKCVKCGLVLTKCNLLERHYKKIHHISLAHETLPFPSFSDFNEWKSNIERENIVSFINRSSWNNSTYATKQFVCHRSGFYRDRSSNVIRKRLLKDVGSKKIDGHCPARINVKINNADGTCVVDYISTHLGHTIRNKQELCHIYINLKEKLKLSANIHNSATVQESERSENLHNDLKYEDPQRLAFECNDSDVRINELPELDGNPVLFYKPQMVEDKELNVFNDEDFVLIYMNENQERELRRYGHKIICFDVTRGSNKYDLLLHTLLVLDVNYEGVPVAFILSNRSDQLVIDVLLTRIRNRVGTILPKCLLTDLQTMYINSWRFIMGEPEHHLYCSWHVRQAWSRNLPKIKCPKKRLFIRNLLYKIASELNVISFEEKLLTFLIQKNNDEDLLPFLEYFREHFVDNGTKTCWAYCFRKDVGITTNMFLESCRNKLKCLIGEGLIIEKLGDAVQILTEFVKYKEEKDLIKEIGSNCNLRLRRLREKHHRAAEFAEQKSIEDVLNIIDENTLLVQSFKDENKFYTVKKNSTKECVEITGVVCRLRCSICQICVHDYRCECFESVIRSNICKHIHIIGLFLRKQQIITVSVDDGALSSEDDQHDDCIIIFDEFYLPDIS